MQPFSLDRSTYEAGFIETTGHRLEMTSLNGVGQPVASSGYKLDLYYLLDERSLWHDYTRAYQLPVLWKIHAGKKSMKVGDGNTLPHMASSW